MTLKTRRRWEEYITINRRGTGCEGVNWMNLTQDRDQWRAVVNTVMNLRVTEKGRNFLNS
jgi:hypothetical protein